jgi:hypothetical protein
METIVKKTKHKKKKRPCRSFVTNSLIPGIGKGLFALVDIKKESIIAYFKGQLRKDSSECKTQRSNIFFHDNSVLECSDDCVASYANDAINFSTTRRQLVHALNTNTPFYKKHIGAVVNASIQVNNDNHTAYLKAEIDILKNTEIFCHYGFQYWFTHEMFQQGFLGEQFIEDNGFPSKIYKYPGFIAYIHEFYHGVEKIQIKKYDSYVTDVILHFSNKTFLVMPIKDYSKLVTIQRLQIKE